MNENSIFPDSNEFLSGQSRKIISYCVQEMMLKREKGVALERVIADALSAGGCADTEPEMSEELRAGLALPRNSAQFLAEYIVQRICEQTEASVQMMADSDSGIRALLDGMIEDCAENKAIRRMHQMNECLRMIIPMIQNQAYGDCAAGLRMEIPAYSGEYSSAALEALTAEVTVRLKSLSLSEDMLRRYADEFRKHGDACLTSSHIAEGSIELKALTATAFFILARSCELPEVADDIPLEFILSWTCIYSDIQAIGDTVSARQDAFGFTKSILNAVLIAGVAVLIAVLIKTGTLAWLVELLLSHPLTLLLCFIAACAVIPAILTKIRDAQDEIAKRAADIAVSAADARLQDYLLPPLSGAKDSMTAALERLTALFARREAKTSAHADAAVQKNTIPATVSETAEADSLA